MNKVSIVVPVYNKEKYIERCIESIIHQSYYDIEVIFIDDGSADRSFEIISQYSRSEERIIACYKENEGRASARNRGIEIASGNYICFVDADDVIEPAYVEKMLKAAEEAAADIAICEMSINSVTGTGRLANHLTEMVIQTDLEFLCNYISQSGGVFATSSCNKLFNMSFVKKYNLKYRQMTIGEDFFFCIEAFANTPKVVTISESLYIYYQNIDSTMHSFSNSYFTNILKLMKLIKQYGENSNNFKIASSCSGANVKNIFKLMSAQVYNQSSIRKKIREISKIVTDQQIAGYLQGCNEKSLAKNYRLVYRLYSRKWTLILYLLCEYYLRRST